MNHPNSRGRGLKTVKSLLVKVVKNEDGCEVHEYAVVGGMLVLCALVLSFLLNMVFVVVSRTALVTMPAMLAVFAVLHFRLRAAKLYSFEIK